jgi:hypothetical protein
MANREWQPIETAPKDESVLVVVWFDGHPEIQIATFNAFREGDERGAGDWQKDADYWPPEAGSYAPTHWMQLPDISVLRGAR